MAGDEPPKEDTVTVSSDVEHRDLTDSLVLIVFAVQKTIDPPFMLIFAYGIL